MPNRIRFSKQEGSAALYVTQGRLVFINWLLLSLVVLGMCASAQASDALFIDAQGDATLNGNLQVNGGLTANTLTGNGAVPSGVIVMWHGDANKVPKGWAICNGQKGTPDLRSRFVVGATGQGDIRKTGEPDQHTHSVPIPKSKSSGSGHSHKLPAKWYERTMICNSCWACDKCSGLDVAGSYSKGKETTQGDGAHGHSPETSSVVSGQSAGANRPKWYAVYYIMKL